MESSQPPSPRPAAGNVVLERMALGLATVLTVAALYVVPAWTDLLDPCILASIASAVTLILIYVARWRGDAGVAFERGVLALFLAGMPVIYVTRWLAFRPQNSPPAWLAIELVGLGMFGLLAVLGLERSPWFLAVGIVGHGVVWDVSHQTSAFMPSWYWIMCLLVDVGLGLYTAARIPTWSRAAAQSGARSGLRPAPHVAGH